MLNKKLIVVATLIAVLVVGVFAVSAQDTETTPEPDTTEQNVGPKGNRPDGPRGGASRELIEEYTGLSGDALREAAQTGTTLAALIEANGQSVDDFIAAAVAEAEARIQQAVEDGKLDSDTAAERIAELETNITEMVNSELPVREARDGDKDDRPLGGASRELIEEYTGLSGDALREATESGSTLAQLIEANGQSVDDFIAAAVAESEARIQQAVEDGKLDSDTAAERIAELETNITEMVNSEFSPRPPRDGFNGKDGRRPGGPRGDERPGRPDNNDDNGDTSQDAGDV